MANNFPQTFRNNRNPEAATGDSMTVETLDGELWDQILVWTDANVQGAPPSIDTTKWHADKCLLPHLFIQVSENHADVGQGNGWHFLPHLHQELGVGPGPRGVSRCIPGVHPANLPAKTQQSLQSPCKKREMCGCAYMSRQQSLQSPGKKSPAISLQKDSNLCHHLAKREQSL